MPIIVKCASEIEKELSPSIWAKRLSPAEVIIQNIKITRDLTVKANETLKNKSFRYGINPMEFLTIYGLDLPNG